MAIDIDSSYSLSQQQIDFYQENGFIKLKDVLSAETLAHYGCEITEKVIALNPNRKPLAERDTYHKAFIQISNLWEKSELTKAFVLGKRLGRVAAELMQVRGTRLYHDQALYKEPSGGFTPWHADQQYWPLATEKCVTAWIPLQETPVEMGPLAFAAKSQNFTYGRDLPISDDSEVKIRQAMEEANFEYVEQPFALGEVSFHAGWTFHRAGPNSTTTPRAVMTIIYMDIDMLLGKPANEYQKVDRDVLCPGIAEGATIDSPKNPVIYER